MTSDHYIVRRESRSEFLPVRGLSYHVRSWGDASRVTPERPPLVMLHGWMDVGASFQFVVDALAEDRYVVAPDWRGFGLTETPQEDSYWFADYLGDLDSLVDHVLAPFPGLTQIDLLGHSMGGNVVMIYAGVRPTRIRRLVNLEGFGMPATIPSLAPKRYALWLDELKQPVEIRPYQSVEAVAARLRKTNPLLPADRAAWLAGHWSQQDEHGLWQILGDPAHKRSNPLLYQRDEVLACWKQITAPVLWVEGDQTDVGKWWGGRYSKPEFHERLKVVARYETHLLSPAGHMLHHDQPEALARRLEAFLAA
ncbi:MAG TPA: alpha/beta hydrolase [Rhizobacter sp.]|jgi:pimeloyl-ACP methyl ester carboxylesterase|nr:alpha/beta hydrolase [Rhizobacter sp.]